MKRLTIATSWILFLLWLIASYSSSLSASKTNQTIYWGAYISGDTYGMANPPWDIRAIDTFEAHTKKKISILHWGQHWYDCTNSCGYRSFNYQIKQFDAMRQMGIIPLLSWHSWNPSITPIYDQPQFSLAAIINGDHDAYIRQWATEAKQWGHPFFLRFDHEMNGNWYPWSELKNGNSAGQYVQAWRHVHDIFTQVGATNVTWVWCVNVDYTGAISLASLYPGDSYVDWMAIDGYNWGTNPHQLDRWKSFNQVFASTYNQLLTISPSKPIMIAEMASTEIGGPKASWITDAFTAQIPTNFPNIKAVLWFNWNAGGMDWTIESSTTAQNAFANAIASPYYASMRFTNLDISPIPPFDQLPWKRTYLPLLRR